MYLTYVACYLTLPWYLWYVVVGPKKYYVVVKLIFSRLHKWIVPFSRLRIDKMNCTWYVGRNIIFYVVRMQNKFIKGTKIKGYVLTKWNAALSWTGRWPYRHWNAYWNALTANGPAGLERSGEKDNWHNMCMDCTWYDIRRLIRYTGTYDTCKYVLHVCIWYVQVLHTSSSSGRTGRHC